MFSFQPELAIRSHIPAAKRPGRRTTRVALAALFSVASRCVAAASHNRQRKIFLYLKVGRSGRADKLQDSIVNHFRCLSLCNTKPD